jgi:hypothetical protein
MTAACFFFWQVNSIHLLRFVLVALGLHPSLHLLWRHFLFERRNGPHVPEGSATRPSREPKNMSVIGMISFAPALTAHLNNSSEFLT